MLSRAGRLQQSSGFGLAAPGFDTTQFTDGLGCMTITFVHSAAYSYQQGEDERRGNTAHRQISRQAAFFFGGSEPWVSSPVRAGLRCRRV